MKPKKKAKKSWCEYRIIVNGKARPFSHEERCWAIDTAKFWKAHNKEHGVTQHIVVKKVRVTEI